MAVDLKELCEKVARERTAGGHLRRRSRNAVVELIDREHAHGASYREIANALGVKLQTLMSWRSQEEARRPALVPVRLPMQAPQRFMVHGPRGLRVEGITLDELASLWLRLSP